MQNPNLNRLPRIKSKDKILISEEGNSKERNLNKKPSPADELIKEVEKDLNKNKYDANNTDKLLIKKPIVFPGVVNTLNKIGNTKPIIRRESEQNSFILNNSNIDNENIIDKKTSNKIIFKNTNVNNIIKTFENPGNKISPNSTTTQLGKLNSVNNQNIEVNTNNSSFNSGILGNSTKNTILNKPILNSTNNSINSGKIQFNNKIDSNFNNNEKEKTINTSYNGNNLSQINNENNLSNEIISNQKYNNSHLKKYSNLGEISSNVLLNNSDFVNPLNKQKVSGMSNREVNAIDNYNSNNNPVSSNGFTVEKNSEKEKISTTNKIGEINNIRNNIGLKKPAIMGAAYGNISASKPLIKAKNDILINKKLDENNPVKK
jgi:hypothetical protein